MRWLGMGYRAELRDWFLSSPPEIKSLEITAEHFFDGGDRVLKKLADRYPLFVHGLGLSLGTPGPLCQKTLEQFARVAEIAQAKWVSEHVSFTRTDQVDLGHLNPVPHSRDSLETMVEHAIEVAQRCNRKLILENITSDLLIAGDMSETAYLNQLCERAGCGLLLDVTNLFINSKNHGYDPKKWLAEIEPSHIMQLHVVGYSRCGDVYQDHHSAPIQEDLMELIAEVIDYSDIQAITLERDDRLDELDEIKTELKRLDELDVSNNQTEIET